MSADSIDLTSARKRFCSKRLRNPINPSYIVSVRACWSVHPVAEHDLRRFALLLTSGQCAYADGSGTLLGGWVFEEVEDQL